MTPSLLPARPPTPLLALLLAGCAGGVAGDPPAPPVDERARIDTYVRSLAPLTVEPETIVEGPPGAALREGDYQCVRRDMSETRQHDRLVAYAANSESLWPGALVRGDSVYSGELTQIVLDRAPLRFSVSLENLAGDKSATMEQPSLSAYRDALGHVLDAEITGATPANISAEIEEVHSQEQLALALGASASWPGVANIAASFDFARDDVRSRYLVRYLQAYYTVDVDQPGAPSDLFADSVTRDGVAAVMGPGNPPTYVSSITYGRMIVFTFESEYSARELGAALEFAYRGGVEVSGDVSVSYRDIVSHSTMSAYVLGGAGGAAARSIDSYEALMDLIHGGGDYSRESPGSPIAYKLAYLRDNAPARLSFTTDYQVEDCERVSQKVRVTLERIAVDSAGGDSGGNLELYGRISAEAAGSLLLFDRSEGEAIRIDQGQAWPASGIIGEGVLEVRPQPGESIALRAELLDTDGLLPSDGIGDETLNAVFENGWRREVNLLLTGDRAQVTVVLRLEPI